MSCHGDNVHFLKAILANTGIAFFFISWNIATYAHERDAVEPCIGETTKGIYRSGAGRGEINSKFSADACIAVRRK